MGPGPTRGFDDAEQEIATIRCLVAQQLHAIERHERSGPERRAADLLLRQLLARDEALRQRMTDAIAAIPVR